MTELNIPSSQHVVDVSVIDSTARIKVPTGFFIKDTVKGHEILECPAYSFLIQHSTGKKVLFDLGLRPDVKSFPPIIVKGMSSLDMSAEKGIATILEEEGIAPGDIEAIIWR